MSMDIILDKICDELEEHAEKIHREGKMSTAELKEIAELVDIKKNILKAEMLEKDGEYSRAGDWEAMGRGHFGDYDRGNSYRGRKRDDMGRYSRNRHGYSRDGGESMIEHVDRMMDEAETPEEREVIKRFKREIERVSK